MELQKINTQQLYANIRGIGFYFFAVLGFTHLITGFLIANQISIKSAWLINRLLDVPFFIVSYIYFATLFKLQLDPHSERFNIWDLVVISIGIVLSILLQIYDLMLPNTLPVI